MLAVQSQEFWAGRWALAARTRGPVTLAQVDRLFDQGVLIRAWTQRGTLHILPAADLAWLLSVTGERQLRSAARRYRELGLGSEELATVERLVRGALRGGNGLTRAELFALLESGGQATAGQRGVHAIQNLALRGIVCQGPVVARAGAVSREQLFVLAEEHITGSIVPADPLAELFVRYVVGHGPATAEDFAWWSGLPLGDARAAADAADERVTREESGLFLARTRPRRDAEAPSVLALGAFEEYYISYADRALVCSPEGRTAVGPGRNGMVRPVIVADGVVVGTWRQSTAIGRHTHPPEAELFAPDGVDPDAVTAALQRYADFVAGA